MTQYGFFIDQSRCIGCNSCTVSCMQWHDIPPGTVKWIRVHQWETGTFPHTRLHMLPITCYHCDNPVCIRACPNSAIFKEEKYGAVLVDSEKCKGTRKCWQACPYGAPQFQGDEPGAKMSKCNMCNDRLEHGLKPICVLSCSMRALEFGPIDELFSRYRKQQTLESLPKETITRPSVVFKPADPKIPVINYDSKCALELWRRRQPHEGERLPDIFGDITEVIDAPLDIVGRNKLILKAKSRAEQQYYTADDE